MILTQVIDENSITAFGKNASIKRKNGKTEKIPPMEEQLEISALVQSGKATKAQIELMDKKIKPEEGDTIITGAGTTVMLKGGGNRKKDAGIKNKAGEMSINIFENSEAKITGVKEFKAENKIKDEAYFIGSIESIEFTKGSFLILSADEIKTPFADVIFHGKRTSGFFEITPKGLYCFPNLGPGGTVEFINKRTKKSFITKQYKPEDPIFTTEIVVNDSGIYRVPITEQDDSFLRQVNSTIETQTKAIEASKATAPMQQKMMEKMASGEMQTEMLSAFNTLDQMTADDYKKLAKKAGVTIPPEQMKMMEQIPEMMKKMKNSGMMEQYKKGMAQAGGIYAGMGQKNIGLMSKQIGESMDKALIEMKKTFEQHKKAIKEYKVPKEEYKVA